MSCDNERPVCDYEGSAYRTEFWGEGRDYEDAAERVALRELLPPTGRRLIEIGGGYGRLVPLYSGYEQVVVFDYALSQLRQAKELWGAGGADGRPRYAYVAGDFYALPFAPRSFDTVVMVRTLHHATDPPSVLQGVSRILLDGGTFILEFANKRNLKAILRYLVGRQDWSPFDREPIEFVCLNFDFHPAYVDEHLSRAGLQVRKRRAVSSFRLGILKRLVPHGLLVALDRLLQPTAEVLALSPSVFVRCQSPRDPTGIGPTSLLRCPACGFTPLEEKGETLLCGRCGTTVPIEDGVYDFRAASPRADSARAARHPPGN